MNTTTQPLSSDDAVIDPATMPVDMVMYWRQVYAGDFINPPEAAPIWEFCDEEEIPERMTCCDETGLVLVEEGQESGITNAPPIHPNQCPSCHRRDGLNPRGEVLQCVYCGWEPVTDIIHDAPDKEREQAEDAAFSASLLDPCRPDDLAFHLVDEGLLTWDKLLESPGYVECDVADIRTMVALSLYGPGHSLGQPFCDRESCACRRDDDLFDRYIFEPMLAGLLTSYEASRMMWGE